MTKRVKFRKIKSICSFY